jgi:hypothetical protein
MRTDTRTEPTRRATSAELRFPEVGGRRSTTATSRGILADAARAAEPLLAGAIEDSERWREDYIAFVHGLTAISADSDRALAVAGAGVDSMRRRLVLEGDGTSRPLSEAFARAQPGPTTGTGEICGTQRPVERLRVPYRGEMLEGAALRDRLSRWAHDGIVEPSVAEAMALVSENPDWLALPGRTIALIGAGSEVGPLGPLCEWGADVLAVDLPHAAVWERVGNVARTGGGRLRMPLAPGGTAGLDVVRDLAGTRAWIADNLNGGEPVLGMYGYADGGAHVLLTGAFDALASDLTSSRPETALSYLATPTDAYLVPEAAVQRSRAAYRARRLRRALQAPAKLLSGGRLYRPAYGDGAPVADALVSQQGPNYAVAKRLQRWRGMLARAEGRRVSFNVAPATWTRSVTKNRVLAAAYAGAGHFGIEIFAPATTRALMAALLVHDLHTDPPAERPPEQLFSDGAAHGGLWTAAYEPRSALGVAALAGLPATLLGRGGGS